MVKMSDIAKAVGVSISTVSRVMNNSSAISSETRGKILEAARSSDTIGAQSRSFPQRQTMLPE